MVKYRKSKKRRVHNWKRNLRRYFRKNHRDRLLHAFIKVSTLLEKDEIPKSKGAIHNLKKANFSKLGRTNRRWKRRRQKNSANQNNVRISASLFFPRRAGRIFNVKHFKRYPLKSKYFRGNFHKELEPLPARRSLAKRNEIHISANSNKHAWDIQTLPIKWQARQRDFKRWRSFSDSRCEVCNWV